MKIIFVFLLFFVFLTASAAVNAQAKCYLCSYCLDSGSGTCKNELMADSPICPVDGKTSQEHFAYAFQRDHGQTIAQSEMWRVACESYSSLSSAQDGIAKKPGYAQKYGRQLSFVSLPSVNMAISASGASDQPATNGASSEQYLADMKMVCAAEIEVFATDSQQKTGATRAQSMAAVEKIWGESRKGLNAMLNMAASGKYPTTFNNLVNCTASRRLAQLDGKVKLGGEKTANANGGKKKPGTNMTKCVGLVDDKWGAAHSFNKCNEPISLTYCYKAAYGSDKTDIFRCKKKPDGTWNQGSHDLAPGDTGSLADNHGRKVSIFACKKGEIASIYGWAKDGKPLGRCIP